MSDILDIKGMVEKYGKAIDAIVKDQHDMGENYKTIQAQVETQKKEIMEALTAVDTRLVVMARGQAGALAGKKIISPEAKSVIEYVSKGVYDDIGKKSATFGDPSTGGYVAPTEYVNTIVEKMYDSGAIRSIAEVIPVTGVIAQIPFETSDSDGHWVGETESRDTDDSGGLGLSNVTVNELSGRIKISNRLLMSSVTSIEQYFTKKLTNKLTRLSEAAFATGNGSKKPEGLFECADVESVASGAAATVTTNGLLDMIAAVPTDALTGARFVMSNKTLIGFAKLKDTTGQYLLQPAVSAGMPMTLWGYPVTLSSFAPVHTTANNKCASFGDHYSAYKIVQSDAMQLVRDNITGVSKGMTYINFNAFMGGQVVMPSSIVYMEVKAS